jgi:archaea-specific DNA-binding protein
MEADNTQKENTQIKNNPPEKTNSPDNVIFIGSKPLVNYIRSVVLQFKKPNSTQVTIKSRGKFISKAVDIAEVARRKYLEQEGVKISEIKINSEEFEKDNRKINVSTMDITLSK